MGRPTPPSTDAVLGYEYTASVNWVRFVHTGPESDSGRYEHTGTGSGPMTLADCLGWIGSIVPDGCDLESASIHASRGLHHAGSVIH